MSRELRELLHTTAVVPASPPDIQALVARGRRRRRTVRGVAAAVAVLTVVAFGVTMTAWLFEQRVQPPIVGQPTVPSARAPDVYDLGPLTGAWRGETVANGRITFSVEVVFGTSAARGEKAAEVLWDPASDVPCHNEWRLLAVEPPVYRFSDWSDQAGCLPGWADVRVEADGTLSVEAVDRVGTVELRLVRADDAPVTDDDGR